MGRDTAGLLRKTRTEEKQRKEKKKESRSEEAFAGRRGGTEEIVKGEEKEKKKSKEGGHHLELGKRPFSKTLLHHLPIYTHCFVVCLGIALIIVGNMLCFFLSLLVLPDLHALLHK